ncbi:hypothetical protein KKP04_05830 [Rhodomicrobium sp. Az07]|uniref:hypothetical protein n=1 Tax=Rhodomicrobium sp. Az07 TaxID=2839034 RepID=UPI001BE5CD2B|nr:hypothetical protein [Rhodomicrobium sp. Az07]MBT3070384.1 hypothetical protein [Rhodomicrobium sp. Az07]
MVDTTYDTSRVHDGEDWRAISWSAILFGSLVALSVAAMLHVLGLGITASSVTDQERPTDALMTIGGVAGIWYIASTAVSLFVGGFVASTLSWTFTGKRAAIYALGVWAITTLVVALAFVPPIIRATTGAVSAVGNVAERAITTVAGAGEAAGQAAGNIPSGLVDNVRQRLGIPAGTQVDQGAIRDITQLVGQRLTQDQWTPEQRDRLASALGRAANVPPEEARRRLNEAESGLNATIQEARETVRQALEATRQAIAGAAYWTFAAILAGLIAAYFGARFGERDEDQLPTFARIRMHRGSN